MNAGISRDEWLRALDEAGLGRHDTAPDAISVKEFSVLMGIGKDLALTLLTRMVDAGKAERVNKEIVDITGRRRRIPAYRLNKPVVQ